MLPTLFLVAIIAINITILLVVSFYSIGLRAREKRIEKKETAMDTHFHHAVDEALTKERAIIGDATSEADKIISGAEYITESARESIRDALRDMVLDIQKEAGEISHTFNLTYANSLKQLTSESLVDFQDVSKELQTDLERQIREFRETLLPNMEKQLEEYKKKRLEEIEKSIIVITQKVSQQVLNRSLSATDHQALVIEALEKAKRDGVFD